MQAGSSFPEFSLWPNFRFSWSRIPNFIFFSGGLTFKLDSLEFQNPFFGLTFHFGGLEVRNLQSLLVP